MAKRGEVVWAPNPFDVENSNPRPWLVVSTDRIPYSEEECMVVALTTQGHHSGSIQVSSEDWLSGEPDRDSYVLPWTVATLKQSLHIVGLQGELRSGLVEETVDAVMWYLGHS
jgi:mRNA-degrading endonuclease toxin of MazEF toxin-antitoxin module